MAFVANGSHDFTDGPDDSIRSFFGHAVAAVGHQHLASATGPLRESSLKLHPSW